MMKHYNSYKDSGIEWIGVIPSHWDVSRFKYKTVSPLQYGLNTSSENYIEEGIRFVRITDISDDSLLIEENGKYLDVKDVPHEYLLNRYDVLFCRSGHTVGKSYFHLLDGNYTSGGYLVRLNFGSYVESKFVIYVSKTNYYWDWIRLNTIVSTIENVNGEKYNNFTFPIPPISEQEHIVSYLDDKTKKIDELIQKKLRKIDLLKEYRTSLINTVVTKGLNPNVPMKDSGIEWIGEIPSHWEVKRVKHLIEDNDGIKIGPFGSSLKLDTLTEDGIKVYGQGNIIKDDFNIGHRHISFESFESDFSQYEIFEGDVLITMMGTTGKSKVFRKEFKKGILDSHLLRLRFKKSLYVSDLFVTILQESDYVFHQLRLNSKGSIMEGLNSSIVKELVLLSQPISEQEQIVTYLDEKTSQIYNTIEIEKKKIELLKEYRQSLISNVVTGKINISESV
jgi:type I restriction enzyme, S subunit